MHDAILSDILKWSGQLPGWQRDALRRVFSVGRLSEPEIADLAELCKASHGLSATREVQPLKSEHLRIGDTGTEAVRLSSVTHLTGVNALASNQRLSFGLGLTIVYGENGAGKSGYTRILKAATVAS